MYDRYRVAGGDLVVKTIPILLAPRYRSLSGKRSPFMEAAASGTR